MSEVWAHSGLGKGKILLQITVQDPGVLQLLDVVSLLKTADPTAELAEKNLYEDSPSTQMKVGQPNP